MNPPMEDVLPVFNTWVAYVTFYSRGLQFGTLVFRFKDDDMAYVMTTSPVKTEKLAFYPLYMCKMLIDLRIGWIPV